MSFANFKAQIWAAVLLSAVKTNLVYGQAGVVNHDYEGEIQNMGDTVKITSVSDPTIGTYVPNSTTITFEELTDAQRNLLIDQAKYFAFQIDDVDKRQAAGNIMTEAMDRAGYGIAKVQDSFIAGLYTGAAAANAIGTVSVTTADLAYAQLQALKKKLDEADIPDMNRYCIARPWFFNLMLGKSDVIRLDATGSTDAIRNGKIGRLLGFDLMQSNQAPLVTGDDYVVQAGVPEAITFAQQISQTEALRPQNAFSDAVKGLSVYGAKLIRPTHIATVFASIT